MQVDSGGNVTDYEIFTSVIHSKRRFTYNEVQRILDENAASLSESDMPVISAMVSEMDGLRKILRAKRDRRGALDFDLPETKIRVDENGRVISIEAAPRNNATGIIEEFMILCNETIAQHFLSNEIPFVFRSHDKPNSDKLANLQAMITNLGVDLKTPAAKRVTAKSLQNLLTAAKETPAAYAVSSALLRSLPQANYTTYNPQHFGLASTAYCHFTSPIRRYADLQIHRIIKNLCDIDEERLAVICAQCSKTERVAEALERDVEELKKVQFMADKKGDSFSAIVSGMTSWGVYVLLENTADGLLPASNLLRHRFKFNKEYNMYERKRAKGEKSAKVLRHGTPITVRLTGADEDERRLHFVLEMP
jgi:ribonuclease R